MTQLLADLVVDEAADAPVPSLPPAGPIVKWAGGKTRLLPDIFSRIPANFQCYHEPFLGGGAVFYALRVRGMLRGARLSDQNQDLFQTYTAVRDDVDSVIQALSQHHNDSDYYYEVRAQDPATLSHAERAARFLFLNRTCFNGLYRVNKKGKFNVPFGRYVNPRICNVPALKSASIALRSATLSCSGFEGSLAAAQAGDFVYLDPPYAPRSRTASFTCYTKGGFGGEDQERLRNACRDLDQRGVSFLLSNADVPLIRELYDEFTIEQVMAPRSINARGDRRGKVTEVMVRNY